MAKNPLYLPCVILIANWHIHSCGSHEDPLAWSKVKAASVERRSLASSSVRAVAHTVLRSPLLAIRAAKRGALCTRYRWALIFFFSCSWGWGYSNSPYPPQLLFFFLWASVHADRHVTIFLTYPSTKPIWPLFLAFINIKGFYLVDLSQNRTRITPWKKLKFSNPEITERKNQDFRGFKIRISILCIAHYFKGMLKKILSVWSYETPPTRPEDDFGLKRRQCSIKTSSSKLEKEEAVEASEDAIARLRPLPLPLARTAVLQY